MQYETWYVLADGRVVDPRFVVTDERGLLRHQDGVAVAVGPHGPRSRGVDVAALAREAAAAYAAEVAKARRDAVAAADSAEAEVVRADREMKPAGGGAKYKTR